MSHFLLTFIEVVGVIVWAFTGAILLVSAAFQDELKDAAKCVGGAILWFALGFTVEIYGLNHWWK